MAQKATQTEHAGAKHGAGAYYGYKYLAKKESNKVRRRADKKAAKENN